MLSKYCREWNKLIWFLYEFYYFLCEGVYEVNDVFAFVNGVSAFALCAFGFFILGVFGGLCFGVGLGIMLYGIVYMYVYDGLVYKCFFIGLFGKFFLLRKIVVGYTIYYIEAFEGVFWGFFFGI